MLPFNRVDELLGGQGWSTGEVSEICGISGSGKTQLCLSTMSTMLIQDRSSYAIWIDTLDGGFSGQRTSDIIQTQLSQQEDFDVPKEQALEILSRIHLCACQDIFDIINAIESIRKGLEQPTVASLSSIRLIVIDSMSEVLTKLMQNDNNTGYATMMHLSRELRRIAIDFNLTVLVG
ncbi:P-loop containing nucleoside triphosphate hydrolase protein [Lobosporangium transversale]|uniref:p-loop containing nucleoside triphosphate hydrolase protein n=1 Tax=Lobosporangium transversale TaxID=64571 RepID=A0A1Y2GJM1_9FUNG|nr:P-loop containing nucleoside triphosphate hydrolase protein [Lobosporangium transversale]ORZ12929.1 P-loop containing nucleoside triphosphate hydrolase protein [Lobosporangium transversale]|eukprot:XP_021880278.1 P-loop containing nucleoside triphosphate hydrolase protein [Lobosporangium transversale]